MERGREFRGLRGLATLPGTPARALEPSPVFEEQLTAFEVWLRFGADLDQPPEQLPIVLQVLLSQAHRVRALVLLRRFLDLGARAVNLALCVGIFPYVLKLLQSPAPELRRPLVAIWADILAFEPDCRHDLIKDPGGGAHLYFVAHVAKLAEIKSHHFEMPPPPPPQQTPPEGSPGTTTTTTQQQHEEVMDPSELEDQTLLASFVLSVVVKGSDDPGPVETKVACLEKGLATALLDLLKHRHDRYPGEKRRGRLRRWLCLLTAALCEDCAAARTAARTADSEGRTILEELVSVMATDKDPTARAAGVRAVVACFFGSSRDSEPCTPRDDDKEAPQSWRDLDAGLAKRALVPARRDASALVRKEVALALGRVAAIDAHRACLKDARTRDAATTPWRVIDDLVDPYEAIAGALSDLEKDPADDVARVATAVASALDEDTDRAVRTRLANALASHPGIHQWALDRFVAEVRSLSIADTLNNAALDGQAVKPTTTTKPPRRRRRRRKGAGHEEHKRRFDTEEARSRGLSIGSSRPSSSSSGVNVTPPRPPRRKQRLTRPKRTTSRRHLLGEDEDMDSEASSSEDSSEDGGLEASLLSDPLSAKGELRLYRRHRNRYTLREARALADRVRLALDQDDEAVGGHGEPTAAMLASNANNPVAPPIKFRQACTLDNSGADMTRHLRFHPHEPYLAVVDDRGLSLWDYEAGTCAARWTNGGDVLETRVSTVTGIFGTTVVRKKPSEKKKVTAIEWLDAAQNSLLLCGSDDGVCRIWSRFNLEYDDEFHMSGSFDEADHRPGFAQDDLFDEDKRPKLLTSFVAVDDLAELTPKSSGLVLTWAQRDGLLFASGDSPYLRAWDARAEQLANKWPIQTDECVTCLAYHRDKLVFAGFGDGSLKLFDTRSKHPAASFGKEHDAWIVHVSAYDVAPRRQLVSACLDGDARFWDFRVLKKSLSTVNVQSSTMTNLVAHETAPLLASGSHNQFIKFMARDGRQLNIIRYHDGFLGQRIGPVSSLAFHPSKLLAAAGSTDSIVGIYAC